MINLDGRTPNKRTALEVHPIDPNQNLSQMARDYICVLTLPHPENIRRIVTNVVCSFCLSGVEVRFRKNPVDSEESFEDALNWAKSFATRYGISTIYASNFSAKP